MPKCGSQIILCDLPIRYDTYKGCSHACQYCFVNRKVDIRDIGLGEGVKALESFINGNRNAETNWCDWNIPLHWGGMSDPFQPAEKHYKRSLEALKVFAQTKYPFVVSTKNKLIAESPYIDLLKECECVVQFSAACQDYDQWERGASTFAERLEAAKKISALGKRVIIRVQPYLPKYLKQICDSLELFKNAGVYGVVVEAMKYQSKMPGTVKVNGDFCIPAKVLKQHYELLKSKCHQLGMVFYCGENRLRGMSDHLCCCGVDGLGWRTNTANVAHYIYDRDSFVFTDKMCELGTTTVFQCLHQQSVYKNKRQTMTYKDCMLEEITENNINALTPKV